LIKAKRASRILLAVLALSMLASPGCQAPEAPPSPTPAPSVTLALLGDVMLGRGVHPTKETFAYLEPFLTSADLALANLESPLTNAPAQSESPYVLCARPENVRYLVDAGLDYLALSNNHRLDCGRDGLLETERVLAEAGLGFIGPDPEPVSLSVNGVQLSLLAFDATDRFDLETALRAVRSAREAGALVIVSMHWGAEYQGGASTGQTHIAEQLADAGAALIWGHHPHVLQPSAWLPQTHDQQTLVFYSLGNALFDQYGLEVTRRSALALVKLKASGAEEFQVIPFLIDIRGSRVVQAGPEDAQIIRGYFK
jgi:poly-gamma-glutamate synthesis protein (capsule biosynthesis protein)